MSEKIDVVSKALMIAKKQMGPVFKDATNPYYKSKYASLGAFIDATDSALTDNGILLFQCVGHENEKPVLFTTLTHAESGQWIRSSAPLINKSGDSQGLGSAITYMRRYSLCAMLGICADEDDDGNKSIKPEKTKKEKQEEDFLKETQVQKDNHLNKFLINGKFNDEDHYNIRCFLLANSQKLKRPISESIKDYSNKDRLREGVNLWIMKQNEKKVA